MPIEGEIAPQLPLCERPPAYVTQLATLLTWRNSASQQAALAGAAWVDEPDAPSVEDLDTELSWLLDDAVVGVRSPGDDEWQQQSWRDVERSLRLRGEPGKETEVSLREPLEELGRQAVNVSIRFPIKFY